MKQWEKQERRTAKRYNGTRSPNSGAGPSRKNDVRNEHLLIECKHTSGHDAGSLSSLMTWRKLRRNAIVEGRTGVLQFELAGRTYVILLEGDFLDIYGHDR